MAFAVGVSGGTLHTQATSFQGLSIGGRQATHAAPGGAATYAPAGNLSHAAGSAFQAILNLNGGSGSSPISFKVTAAPVTPVLLSAPAFPASSKPQYVLPSNPSLVAHISSVARQFAINAVYPAPIFSFAA